MFKATMKDGIRGDIAIDKIIVKDGKCASAGNFFQSMCIDLCRLLLYMLTINIQCEKKHKH